MSPRRAVALLVVAIGLSVVLNAAGETLPGWGRVSFFGTVEQSVLGNGSKIDYSEFTTAIRVGSGEEPADGLEYAMDLRGSAYPSSPGSDSRTRVYDAWVGTRLADKTLSLRVGQMWLTDLGSIGSLAGATAEYRSSKPSMLGRFHAGIFGGAEPESYNVGLVPGVKKYGAWVGLDGGAARRNVLGYVMVKDYGLTERSVITMTNFIPAGKQFFLYQAAEYDLSGPGGTTGGGLSYFFANARYVPNRRVEFMGTYHHGLAIDARTITQDILNGRPVDQRALDGFLFESIGGRLTFEIIPNLRVYGGYSQDKNNSDDAPSGRIALGLWATNIARSGFDLTLSDNRVSQTSGGYDAWYASIGRSFGSRLYVSADYSTSLSIVRITDAGGAVVVNKPSSKRYGLNGTWNVNRRFSLLLAAEELADETATSQRVMLGLSIRF